MGKFSILMYNLLKSYKIRYLLYDWLQNPIIKIQIERLYISNYNIKQTALMNFNKQIVVESILNRLDAMPTNIYRDRKISLFQKQK